MTDYQNELVMEHLDLVNWVIRTRISVPNRPLLTYDDFYAIGCEAICRAALKYQADSGEFAPFACRYIYNAIIDHCRAMNYRLQRSVDAGFEEGEVLFDLLAHTTVDFEAEVTDDSATRPTMATSRFLPMSASSSGTSPVLSRRAMMRTPPRVIQSLRRRAPARFTRSRRSPPETTMTTISPSDQDMHIWAVSVFRLLTAHFVLSTQIYI